MFTGNKPTFGAPATNTAFGFGAANTTASPFGAGATSAFGKPAGSAGAFGAAPAFGQAAGTSAFGQPQQQQLGQPAAGSLFGAPGQQTSAFGAPAVSQPNTGFGGFGQPQQQQQQPSLFGTAPQQQQQVQQQQNTSLFGQASTSAFGAVAKAPAFGFGAAAPANQSLFSQPGTSAGAVGGTVGGFGGFGAAASTAGAANPMFGAGAGVGGVGQSAFGQPTLGGAGGAGGTAIAKYQETLGTDTLMKNGQSNNVSTKQHCITAMKEYEAKSFEELRMEDYMANRKGPQPGGVGGGGGMFGAGGAAASGGLFGTNNAMSTQNASIFGQTAQQPQVNQLGGFGAAAGANAMGGGAFGQTSAFGQPVQQQQQQQQAGGLFGGATAGGGLFGAKPFGQPATPAAGGGLFGQPAVSAAPTQSAFGQPTMGMGGTTGGAFGAFGQPQQLQAAPLFGGGAPAATGGLFGQQQTAAPAAGGFGAFGATATTNTAATGGLFGQKPAQTGFGGLTTGAFGAPATSVAQTGFGSFGQPQQAAQAPGSLFGNSFNKPAAAPAFGSFGAGVQAAAPAANTGLSLFGNTAAKPGGLFGQTAAPAAGGMGGGMFGSSFGAGTTLGGGGMGGMGGGLGQSSLGMNQSFGSSFNSGGLGQASHQQPAGVPIHQQILSMATSPYGDNPIFRDLKPAAGLSEDALKPTNPAAQKALLESSSSQFKVSPRVGANGGGLRLKPVGSSYSKKSLFGGLEEFDSSVEESFSLKPNAKRLIIKPKVQPAVTAAAAASASPHVHSPARSTDAYASAHRRLDIPRPADSTDSSFRNQIPLTASAVGAPTGSGGGASSEGGRRESWLHSNALEKVSKQQQQRLGDGAAALDNTITELVSGNDDGTGRAGRALPVLMERRDNGDEHQHQQLQKSGAHQTSANSSLCVSRSFLDDTGATTAGLADASLISVCDGPPHPCGVVLQRSGYYTIPALDALVDYLAADGSCRVPNFTVGRRGYGSVYFDADIDVAGLNLDELVHFRHKEVIIYPDDENKPPVGCDLNRRAEVTLDQVWPQDKTQREPIKDRERLEAMDYQGKLRRVCDKHDMRFVDYRPETGSWVFRVDHFSKYGLNDSDDEDECMAVDPKKAKLQAGAAQPANGTEKLRGAAVPKLSAGQTRSNDQQKQASGLGGGADNAGNGETFVHHQTTAFQPLSPSSAIAMDTGTDSHKLQLMKASFFVDDDFDGKSVASEQLDGRDSPDQTVPHPAFLRSRFGGPAASSVGGTSAGSYAPPHHHHHQQQQYAASSGGRSSVMLDSMSLPRGIALHGKAQLPLLSTAAADQPPTAVTISRPIGPRSAPLHVRPKVALVRIPRTCIPLAHTLLAQLADGRSAVDVAFAMGRQFRVGWAAGGAMLSLNTLAGSQRLPVALQPQSIESVHRVLYAGRRPDDRSRALLVLSRVESQRPLPAGGLAATMEPHLQLQLRRSRCWQPAGESCPRFGVEDRCDAAGTTLFAEHLEVARLNARLSGGGEAEYAATVWSLCDALWGHQEELEGVAGDAHLSVMRRRDLLSDWLEAVVADEQQARQSKATYLEHLLDLLQTHRVSEACDLCFNNNDINLAFVLAQLSGGPATRQLVQHQMFAWQEVHADAFVAPERLRAYMLAAGVSLVSSAHGALNIYEGLDWLRALALNVWYLSTATASITDSLAAYERSYVSEEFHAQAPLPPYAPAYRAETTDGRPVEDVRFHLLKLYSRRSHPLEALLNPATHTADAMDFRLSWLLMQSLEAIGYRHCGQLARAQLHTSMAAQLEQQGLWHWSIFVLMHLADGGQRELAVQAMLYRYVRLSARDAIAGRQAGERFGAHEEDTGADEDGGGMPDYAAKERFVVDVLTVPVGWVRWAKAVRAGALGKWHVQAEFLLQAEQWPMAHEVIMLHIAPDAIINDNIAYVQRLLLRFGDHHRNVPNWTNQAGILLEYIRLNECFERLRTQPDQHMDSVWLQLQQPLSELCSRINLFPCPTARHRLCQSEIAQRLANLVSGLRRTTGATNVDLSTCTLMRVILEKLPLPQEYAKQKLRELLEDGRLIEELQQQSELQMR